MNMDNPPLSARQHRRFDHANGVYAIDFDSKSERVAGATLKQVCIFYMNPKKRTFFLTGHNDYVFDVNFNRDGTLLASGARDRSVLIFESPSALSNSRSTALNCHFGEVHSVEFTNDSEYLLTGGSDKMVRVISLHKEKQVTCFLKHNNWVRSARFAKSNKYFVSGCDDGMIHTWDLRVQKTTNSIPMNRRVIKVATDSSDRHFAGITPKGISIFDARICKRLQHYVPEEKHIFTGADFHPTKPWILMCQENGSICITDLSNGGSSYQKSKLVEELLDAKFSKCGKYFAFGGNNDQAQLQTYLLDCEANVASSALTFDNKLSSFALKTDNKLSFAALKADNKLSFAALKADNKLSSFALKTDNKLSSSKTILRPHQGSKFTSTLVSENLNVNPYGDKIPLLKSKSSSSLESVSLDLNYNNEKMPALSIHEPFVSESDIANYSLFDLEKLNAWPPFIGLKDGTAICKPVSSDLEPKQYRPDLLTGSGIPQAHGLERHHFTKEKVEENKAVCSQSGDNLLDELDDAWLKCSNNFQKLGNHERKISAMATSLIAKHTKSTYFDKNASNVPVKNFKNWLIRLGDVLSAHEQEMIKLEEELRHEYNKMDP